MKLIDLLSVIDEKEKVVVYSDYAEKLDYYDGKNSISDQYNDSIVHSINTLPDNTICITIYSD